MLQMRFYTVFLLASWNTALRLEAIGTLLQFQNTQQQMKNVVKSVNGTHGTLLQTSMRRNTVLMC